MARQSCVAVVVADDANPARRKGRAERFRPADHLSAEAGDEQDCRMILVAEAVIGDVDSVGPDRPGRIGWLRAHCGPSRPDGGAEVEPEASRVA